MIAPKTEFVERVSSEVLIIENSVLAMAELDDGREREA